MSGDVVVEIPGIGWINKTDPLGSCKVFMSGAIVVSNNDCPSPRKPRSPRNCTGARPKRPRFHLRLLIGEDPPGRRYINVSPSHTQSGVQRNPPRPPGSSWECC